MVKTARTTGAEPWPPADLALPDTIEAIEAGRIAQGELFDEQPDDSRAGRLARILADVPGVTTANKLPDKTHNPPADASKARRNNPRQRRDLR